MPKVLLSESDKERVEYNSGQPTVLKVRTYVSGHVDMPKTMTMTIMVLLQVYRKSLNPVYREKFMFGVETMELPLRTLVFYLFATDKFSNTLVGETEVKLGDLDIYQPITTWLQLTDTGQVSKHGYTKQNVYITAISLNSSSSHLSFRCAREWHSVNFSRD